MTKILIVEDSESERNALRSTLLQEGFSILEAKDGIEGLAMAVREHPDLILLDVRMPNMDGMKMMHTLRKDPWGKTAAIIILTNYDANDAQLVQIATDLPSYFLLKATSSLEQIIEKIHEVLNFEREKGETVS